MRLSAHFIASSIIAAVLYPFFGWRSIFALAGGFLIDIDHYVWFIASSHRKRSGIADLGIKEAYNYHAPHDYRNQLHIFHSLEFLLLLAALAAVSWQSAYLPAVLACLIGFAVHQAMDIYEGCMDDNMDARYFSAVHYIFSRKKVYEVKNSKKLKKVLKNK